MSFSTVFAHIHDYYFLLQFIPFLVHHSSPDGRNDGSSGSRDDFTALERALQRQIDEFSSHFGVLAVIAAMLAMFLTMIMQTGDTLSFTVVVLSALAGAHSLFVSWVHKEYATLVRGRPDLRQRWLIIITRRPDVMTAVSGVLALPRIFMFWSFVLMLVVIITTLWSLPLRSGLTSNTSTATSAVVLVMPLRIVLTSALPVILAHTAFCWWRICRLASQVDAPGSPNVPMPVPSITARSSQVEAAATSPDLGRVTRRTVSSQYHSGSHGTASESPFGNFGDRIVASPDNIHDNPATSEEAMATLSGATAEHILPPPAPATAPYNSVLNNGPPEADANVGPSKDDAIADGAVPWKPAYRSGRSQWRGAYEDRPFRCDVGFCTFASAHWSNLQSHLRSHKITHIENDVNSFTRDAFSACFALDRVTRRRKVIDAQMNDEL